MQYVLHTVKCKHPLRPVSRFLFAGLVSGKTNGITNEFPGILFTIQLAVENTVLIPVCGSKIRYFYNIESSVAGNSTTAGFHCYLPNSKNMKKR